MICLPVDTGKTMGNKKMKIEMYTKEHCPYCTHAKALLAKYGVEFLEYDVTHDSGKISEMVDRGLGQWTVPQIFFDNTPIGGCDDLRILHYQEQLGEMLGLSTADPKKQALQAK